MFKSLTSNTASILKTLKSNIPSFVGVPLLLSGMMRSAAAEKPAELAIVSGTGGGPDWCSGQFWCIQNVVKNITDNHIIAAVTRDFSLTKGGTVFNQMALSICFGYEKLTTVINNVIEALPHAWMGNRQVASYPNDWNGITFHGNAYGLSEAGAVQFQSSYAQAANSCQTIYVTLTAAGIGIGIVAGSAITLTAGFYLYKYFRENGCDAVKKCINPNFRTRDEQLETAQRELKQINDAVRNGATVSEYLERKRDENSSQVSVSPAFFSHAVWNSTSQEVLPDATDNKNNKKDSEVVFNV